ncbi:tRNA uridine-5-carboxymethylaminomethyl(34) synthesis GTPase MnmE [Deinococcus peraridilitoris]|uniref:tRNA modification GTPase MnmE n=1 Tax=Deinococcus peraridilitoris (strain DSM 19664 / LMG 22246 / CIP 109416 / KR-200) TaxID=937777 RepID=L0A5A7_DEIPD|nr:tRNA uridine-5-carboxymethylaminomethyl(34) synthesis GTPase MnmE [Deinococcus peraridilitoris]AFZ68190.1 tRNA modification GTPase TrmE [Deinococcus peraridilitoris DSM 19664]
MSVRLGLADTVAAISTAPGGGAIGIVRLSGTRALDIASGLFVGQRAPSAVPGGRFLFGRFTDGAGGTIDEGLVLVFRGPHSYTGEDVAELQCHGSPAVLNRLLARVLELGARAANPGEFTLRAYLNGRLDLAQAEAVLGLVNARSETARRQATLGLQGALGERVGEIGQRLTRALVAIQALLDYPEEGVPEEDREIPLARAQGDLEDLVATARAGQLASRGARLALIGRPNAGKSSLLNALLGYERSIVTPQAGTTRDYLEAQLELAGVPITLVDTAGLRETEDLIEAAGVRRAEELAQGADLVLVLEDGSSARELLPITTPPERCLWLQTKSDLPPCWHDEAYLPVSAVTGQGLGELREAVRAHLLGNAAGAEVWLTSERQADAALRALEHVRSARVLPDDLASYELELALRALAEISGRDVSEDILDGIFANFCVGK